ncbi:RagB/SusD family nutrient uptake outer membrane protein [Prolixibacteraceae bacterium JC049]|nr:RagB/SusD family nutrient uptake outer membrane protein [Prolixibacteraceae bacterium JC049]
MKKIYNIILFLAALPFLNSCSDYLDVVPDNIPTIEHAFVNRNKAEKFLYTCYSYRPAIGALNDVAMTGSDEIWRRYLRGEWTGTSLLKEGQSASNVKGNMWDGKHSLWVGIRDCNIFLQKIQGVADLEDWEKKRWVSEVKFLKAYYHWQLMKRYGAIPIVDENLPIDVTPEQVKVYREPVDEVTNYIVGVLEEVIEALPHHSDLLYAEEAGRITKEGVMTVRAEVLLFAASPLFNGNPDYAGIVDNRGKNLFPVKYDQEKWTKAAAACKEAIEMCEADGRGLYTTVDPLISNVDEVFQKQTVLRQAICADQNKEVIWESSNTNTFDIAREASPRLIRLSAGNLNNIRTEYAPTLKSVEFFYSANGVPINEDKDWVNNSWYANRFKLRPEAATEEERFLVEEGKRTAYLHFNREPRFYSTIGFDKAVYFGNSWYKFDGDDRNVKWLDMRNRASAGYQAGAYYSITGYNVKKLHSFKDSQSRESYAYNTYLFPIYRMADLYLMYAEALNEAIGPSEEVYKYLDLVRERAGLEGVVDSWKKYSVNAEKPSTKDGLREIIHQERSIELAFEAKRFWDIRRWKKINEMVTPMGWNIYGITDDEFYNVVPVSKKPLKMTTRDYLWPIGLSNLSTNTNLVQNYGW